MRKGKPSPTVDAPVSNPGVRPDDPPSDQRHTALWSRGGSSDLGLGWIRTHAVVVDRLSAPYGAFETRCLPGLAGNARVMI